MFETWNKIMLSVTPSTTLDTAGVFTDLCSSALDTLYMCPLLQGVWLVGCRYGIDLGLVQESYHHLLCIEGSTTKQ